jgi:hypothetical protein
MKAALAAAVLAAATLVVALWTDGVLGGSESAAEVSVSIGIDADPAGNTSSSLGAIDTCISVSTGDAFQVDLFVTDVVDLLAWEAYFVYDVTIVDIVDRDVMMFQAANPGSNVFDVSEGLPDIDGWYGVAAIDIADPPAPDSGSGVLARLSLKAVRAGISPASLSPIDVNNDGKLDLGPSLKDFNGDSIDDADGDGFFDGPISNAQIAVDSPCPGSSPAVSPTATAALPSPVAPTATISETPDISPTPETPAAATPTPTGTPQEGSSTVNGAGRTEDSESAWTGLPAVIGYVVGGLAVLALAGVGFLSIRRGRAR